jgi:PPK2 family polyphosphate:nucleotide phosphotransferase
MKRRLADYPDLVKSYRITHGKKFRLADHDPGDIHHTDLENRSDELLQHGIKRLSEMQEKLYAQDRWGLLLIFQAMDAAGKDSTIQHVMSGVNPQGCQVYSFKQPSAEDLSHDYLWRASKGLPQRGHIGIFNRSYYEEVLVVRVHRDLLENERIPKPLTKGNLWKTRFEDIAAYERYLSRNGIVIRKFFLHVSRQEQKQRFLDRLHEPDKHWKFSLSDVKERDHWDEYMDAYEDAIRHTATPDCPWFVVPADHKWFTRLVVAETIIQTLESLKLQYPQATNAKARELKAAEKRLAHS